MLLGGLAFTERIDEGYTRTVGGQGHDMGCMRIFYEATCDR